MNVGNYSQTTLNIFNGKKNAATAETRINLEDEGRRNLHSAYQGNDLVSQFWNMTDSMPRDNQISFAASIVANRIMKQGITDENKSFMQNISNRFSPEEIGNLKNEILNHPAVKSKSDSDVEAFIKDFDKFIASQKGSDLEPTRKQQVSPRIKNPDEIFFQTTFNQKPSVDLYRAAASI
jgi:hypothetical protein